MLEINELVVKRFWDETKDILRRPGIGGTTSLVCTQTHTHKPMSKFRGYCADEVNWVDRYRCAWDGVDARAE